MFALCTQTHTHTRAHIHTHMHTYAPGALQTLHAVPLSLLHSFFSPCVFSRCRVLFVTPFLRCALLGSPARRLVTAPNRIRSTARLDIHDLSIHQWREGGEGEVGRERNGCLSVKSEIETRGEKLGWKVICKPKQHRVKNIFKVTHCSEICSLRLIRGVYVGISSTFYAAITESMLIITVNDCQCVL